MRKVNLKRIIISIGLISFILVMFLLSRIDQREDFSLIEGYMQELTGPWSVSVNGVEQKNIKLPYDINLDQGILYSSSVTLPFLAKNQDTLLIRSSMQDLWVYLDDVLIHEHVLPESLELHMPPTSLWVLVNIPENSVGKTLRIDYKTSVSAFSGIINQVYLDRKAMILHSLFTSQSFSFGVFLLLFSFGLITIVTSFAFKNAQDLRLLYLGFMSISSGLWILAEARLLQFFIGNRFILGSIAYLMIPIMALFFALYIKDAIITELKFKRHLKYLAFTFIGLVVMNVALQLMGILVYIEMMQYTLPIIFISAIYAAYLIYLEIKDHQNEAAKRFVKFTFILLISLVFEIGSFFFQAFSSISSYFRVGIILFFIMLAIDTFMYIRTNMRRRDENLLLEKMAYKDFLTGGFNRYAYERDVQHYIDTNRQFRLVLLDLNDLKYINDTYGHSQGDEAIRLVFDAMLVGFDYGHNYRIGGDEFAVLVEDVEVIKFEKSVQKFHDILRDSSKDFVHPLKVAIGTDIFDNNKWDFYGKFYHHVDLRMYEHKTKIKSAD